MRAALVFTLASLVFVPGCFGNTANAILGPSTAGDQNLTTWQIHDGLCGGGLFGTECDLAQPVALGAAPFVEVRARNGADLHNATLVGGTGVELSGVTNTIDDDDGSVVLRANVAASTAGVADVIVRALDGHEIDRAHVTFVTATRLTCGALRTNVRRELDFPGLSSDPVDVIMAATETGTQTQLACRADDASGRALLTVGAIHWSIASGAVGSIRVESDDFFGSVPARGATARIFTMGTGSATVHAELGDATSDIAVTFR